MPRKRVRHPMHKDVRAVIQEARRWGVGVSVVDHARTPWKDFPAAPFTSDVGCSVEEARLYVRPCALKRPLTAAHLLHELSHVIQGTHPNSILEIQSGMMYVEYLTARKLKLTAWETWMRDYGLLDGEEWGTAPRESKRDSLRQSREGALAAGLVCGTRLTYERVPYGM